VSFTRYLEKTRALTFENVQVEYGAVDPDSGLREKVPLVHLMCLLPPDLLLPTVTGKNTLVREGVGTFTRLPAAYRYR
jgi:hypothetical protein